jgi:integrase
MNESKKPVTDNDGLYKRGDVWYYWRNDGGKWKEVTTRTRNYQEARKVRHDALEAQKQGLTPSDKGKLPFENAAELWAAKRREKCLARQLSANTIRIDKERLPPLVKYFSGRRLNTLVEQDWQNYQVARGKKVANRTVNMELQKYCAILRDAKCKASIVDYKALFERTEGPGTALSLPEEQKLFETARRNPAWEAAYYGGILAINMTTRGGELKGARLGALDLANRTLTIQRATTKTDAGRRVIPLNDVAFWAVVQLLKRATLLGASLPEHYLFPGYLYRRTKGPQPATGTGYDPTQHQKTWRSAWRSLRKAAGFPTLRFHDLRHTAITKLAEAGEPDHVIMSIAGHLSPQMVRHYTHVRTRAKEAALAKLAQSHSYVPPEVQMEKEKEPPAGLPN